MSEAGIMRHILIRKKIRSQTASSGNGAGRVYALQIATVAATVEALIWLSTQGESGRLEWEMGR